MSPQLFIWIITSFVHTRELLFCNESCRFAAPKYTSSHWRLCWYNMLFPRPPCLMNIYRITSQCRCYVRSVWSTFTEIWPIWWTCTDWLTDWLLVYPGFSISSKFQMKSDGSYWLEMLNFVISNWSKVTILNTLNALVSIHVTLLPLSQPVWTPTRVTLGCLNVQVWLMWDPSSKI